MTIDVDVYDFIEHFGIKGMRWGVRNEDDTSSGSNSKVSIKSQPKTSSVKVPSGSKPTSTLSKQDKRNANAQKYLDKANNIQKQIDTLTKQRESATTGLQRAQINRQITILNVQKNKASNDAAAKREGKLTDTQKKVAIGVGAVAVGLAAYGTYHMIQSGNANRFISKGKAFVQGKDVPWSVNPELSRKDLSADQIMSSVVRDINPDYGAVGTKVNCRRCTMAYEMRRRGYDVAATKTTTGMGQDVTGLYNTLNPDKNNVAPGLSGVVTRLSSEQIKKASNPDFETHFTDAAQTLSAGMGKNRIEDLSGNGVSHHIFQSLANEPEGARGELGVTWAMGGAHSVAWEIIGGKPVIFDTQSGKKFDSVSAFNLAYGGSASVTEAAYTRLDNIPLDTDFLMRWVKDAD